RAARDLARARGGGARRRARHARRARARAGRRHRHRRAAAAGGPAGEPSRGRVGGVPARRPPHGRPRAERVVTPRAAARPPPARAVAARVLERVEVDAAFADLALDAELARRTLAPRDNALATELVFGTLRWQRYLDWILAPHSRRRLATLDVRVRI